MASEQQTSTLVAYFVAKLKLYIKTNGRNELAKEALEFYKNGMIEFHDEQNFQTKLGILKRQATHDQLLEYIYRMGENTNLKESMKKSELKALIKEVIEETTEPNSSKKIFTTDELANKDFVPDIVWKNHGKRLEAEVSKLRSALNDIAELSESGDASSQRDFGDIARTALSQ